MGSFPNNTPKLYGITNSNRSSESFWGKNEFNSSFPVSLCCYMRDNKINATYLKLDENLNVVTEECPFDQLFNTVNVPSENIYFSFESKYQPYEDLLYDDIDNIDLIIKDVSGKFYRPLEIKLTVIPDNSTSPQQDESLWGTEIVFRPNTLQYCIYSVIKSNYDMLDRIRTHFDSSCSNIQSWANRVEMITRFNSIIDALDSFEQMFYENQKPLILQPIWKTKGKSPFLSDQAFDVFVWSDLAFTRLFLDNSRLSGNYNATTTNLQRSMRASLRFARCLYELSKSRKINITNIYNEMTFNLQNDKEFAVNGMKTNLYLRCERLTNPKLSKNVLKKIILNGGEKLLSPERRFDQTIFWTFSSLEEKINDG